MKGFKLEETTATTEVSSAPAKAPMRSPREIIDQWWRERVHNSPVSRDTRAYNFLHAAVEDLKRLFDHQE